MAQFVDLDELYKVAKFYEPPFNGSRNIALRRGRSITGVKKCDWQKVRKRSRSSILLHTFVIGVGGRNDFRGRNSVTGKTSRTESFLHTPPHLRDRSRREERLRSLLFANQTFLPLKSTFRGEVLYFANRSTEAYKTWNDSVLYYFCQLLLR